MSFIKKGLLFAAIPAIIAFINSDYWPKFRDTMTKIAKMIKKVWIEYIDPAYQFLKGTFFDAWEGINKLWCINNWL